MIDCGLIGIVWWSADKLTWDCPLIDESEEDSGEGLLQSIGFERAKGMQRKSRAANRPQPVLRRPIKGTPGGNATSNDGGSRHRGGRVGRLFLAGGVAAVRTWATLYPLGRFIGGQAAFGLLFVYTASGLGLLLSTSFLGLRATSAAQASRCRWGWSACGLASERC